MITYKSPLPQITLKYRNGNIKKVQIKSSRDVYELCHELFNRDTVELQEEFLMILLNRMNNTIGWFRVSQGGISGTVTDLRLIFATATQAAASGIIIAHNHPSGNLNVSDSDIKITQKIKAAGELLDIQLLDHLIYTTSGYTSLADEGQI